MLQDDIRLDLLNKTIFELEEAQQIHLRVGESSIKKYFCTFHRFKIKQRRSKNINCLSSCSSVISEKEINHIICQNTEVLNLSVSEIKCIHKD